MARGLYRWRRAASSRVVTVVGVCAIALIVGARAPEAQGNSALEFNGTSQFGDSSAIPYIDNLWMDLWTNWSGPTGSGGQTIVYNGHSGCTGWGIFIVDSGHLGVFAGGIDIALSAAQLTAGAWHQVRAMRVNQTFSIELDGVEYPLSSNPTPRPIGGCFNPAVHEALIVGSGSGVFDTPDSSPGDAYNGMVDSIRVNGIGKPPKAGLAFWHLNEGQGSSASDIHGLTLTLHNGPLWVAGHGQ